MKNILFLVLLLFTSSCTKKEYYSKEIINEISKGDFIIPSVYGNLSLYVSVDNKHLAQTGINLLHTMYENDYSKRYSSFSSFLFNALNQKLKFEEDYIKKRNGSVFQIDEKIRSQYEKGGLNYLIKNYCQKTDNNYKISNTLHGNSKFTVLYYFSINGYKILEDDNLGAYYAEPF
jgi:hypothetical protein